jgi:hypothetical protein
MSPGECAHDPYPDAHSSPADSSLLKALQNRSRSETVDLESES